MLDYSIDLLVQLSITVSDVFSLLVLSDNQTKGYFVSYHIKQRKTQVTIGKLKLREIFGTLAGKKIFKLQ